MKNPVIKTNKTPYGDGHASENILKILQKSF